MIKTPGADAARLAPLAASRTLVSGVSGCCRGPAALTRRLVHFQIKDELRGVGHRHVPPVPILLGFFRRPNRVVHGFSRVQPERRRWKRIFYPSASGRIPASGADRLTPGCGCSRRHNSSAGESGLFMKARFCVSGGGKWKPALRFGPRSSSASPPQVPPARRLHFKTRNGDAEADSGPDGTILPQLRGEGERETNSTLHQRNYR